MTPDEQRAEDQKAHRHVILFLQDHNRIQKILSKSPWRRVWARNHYTHHWKAKRGNR